MNADEDEEDASFPCCRKRQKQSALRGQLRICVAKLDGSTVEITARKDWRVDDVKVHVERAGFWLRREQRLLWEGQELEDSKELSNIFNGEGRVYLNLLRRDPLQAEWLLKVMTQDKNETTCLETAPLQVREDKEVILAAARQDHGGVSLNLAGPTLWQDKEFVLEAVQLNWRTFLRHDVYAAYSSDRDVTLTVVVTHGRSLRYISSEFSGDQEIILAAMHQRLQMNELAPALVVQRNGAVLETLMRDHTEFVFQHAAHHLRAHLAFMIKMLHKDWRTESYAEPELWQSKEYVLAAVQHRGILLKKASKQMCAEHDVVKAAVTEDGLALQFACEGLQHDRDIV